jgi:hypothetical protein
MPQLQLQQNLKAQPNLVNPAKSTPYYLFSELLHGAKLLAALQLHLLLDQ